MKRMSWHLVVPLALISALSVPAGCVEFDKYSYDPTPGAGGASSSSSTSSSSGAGGMTSSSSGTGGMMGMPCSGHAECAALDSECQKDGQCVSGFCSWTLVAAGTETANQVYGDCNTIVCDGKGAIDDINFDNTEKYVWGNPCYAPTCGTEVPLASNGACTTKWGTSGTCQVDFSCRQCTSDASCSGGTPSCQNGKCVPSHCVNMGAMPDGDETDVDCGGSCTPCDAGKKCSLTNDCVGGGKCSGNPTKVCQAPDCSDGIKNGDETGVDCGGACAMDPTNQKCATSGNCLYPTDCQSGRCEVGVCK